MRNEIAKIVEESRPSCGLKKECWTKCGECGADRIKDKFVEVLKKLGWDRAADDLALYWGMDETT